MLRLLRSSACNESLLSGVFWRKKERQPRTELLRWSDASCAVSGWERAMLPPATDAAWAALRACRELRGFTLIGGTALALQIEGRTTC